MSAYALLHSWNQGDRFAQDRQVGPDRANLPKMGDLPGQGGTRSTAGSLQPAITCAVTSFQFEMLFHSTGPTPSIPSARYPTLSPK